MTSVLRFLAGASGFLPVGRAERGVNDEPDVRTPVAPLLSAIAITRRRIDGGIRSSTFLPAVMTALRALTARRAGRAAPSEVCWTTLSLNSSTLPLEPKAKKAERSVSGPPLPTTVVDGMIWKVSSAALARQPSSKK